VGIRNWDDARITAHRIAAPAMRKANHDGDGDDHFVERARDWVEVLLYAAHLGEYSIATVADWGQQPDAEAVEITARMRGLFRSIPPRWVRPSWEGSGS